MKALTPRQAEVLQFIKDGVEENGYPPTIMEICKFFGFRSPRAAADHLNALSFKGAIEIASGLSRGIRIKSPPGVALIGQVAAGSPLLAEENVQARYRIDPELFNPRADYLLKVRGMSMRDAGIFDGDLLAVHRTNLARSGQVVVARLHDEVTVKRLKRQGGLVQLLPENPAFKPIEVDPRIQPFVIEGIAVGVIRNGRAL